MNSSWTWVSRSLETRIFDACWHVLHFLKRSGVNILQPGCGDCMATYEISVMRGEALGSVVFSF